MTKVKEQNKYAVEVLEAQQRFNWNVLNSKGKNTEAMKELNEELQKAIKILQSQSKGEVIEPAYKKCTIRGKYSGTGNYRTCERCAEEKWIIGCNDYENTKSKGEVIAEGNVVR